jgi:hypothetical protein
MTGTLTLDWSDERSALEENVHWYRSARPQGLDCHKMTSPCHLLQFLAIGVYAIIGCDSIWGIPRDRPVAPGWVAVPSLSRQAVEQCWDKGKRVIDSCAACLWPWRRRAFVRYTTPRLCLPGGAPQRHHSPRRKSTFSVNWLALDALKGVQCSSTLATATGYHKRAVAERA